MQSQSLFAWDIKLQRQMKKKKKFLPATKSKEQYL